LLQISDNFLYWENIENEKQNSILQSKDVSINVLEAYKGTFITSDNEITVNLLDSLIYLTYNEDIRALSFHIFNKILQSADGSLSELFGNYCQIIILSNSEFVIFYLKDNPELLKTYAITLGYEFYFKQEGLSDIKYDYKTFKNLIFNKIKNKQNLLDTFSCLCSEIEKIMQNMD
jgi:hypothetical protein